ncbi:hypothetical protein BT63DRAFT_441270 [Microthyrium microscopicum]|uniref:L domain-like protein n=1 Tax=Microthyrium microscopicum TaxID=703497 RepID=A0A6A6U690_9PEZI|nr:hypothetical protein BT63DRAFT_441270 [Microthyrium microscopicum]
MNQWLDDLSEDWPSQPPSLAASQSSRQLGSSTSRIPRSIRGSGAQLHTGKSLRRSTNGSINVSQRRTSALSERTSSRENIIPATDTAPRLSKPKKLSSFRRSLSAESAQSAAMYETVEKKAFTPSPKKVQNTDETPEWRRRLLMGERGLDQTDLFAPSKIESLFQKPPPVEDKQQRTRGLSFLKGLETIPSSPPWQPTGMLSFASMDQVAEEEDEEVGTLDPVQESDELSRASSRQAGSVIINHNTGVEQQAEDDDVFTDGASSLGSMVKPMRRGKHSAAYSNTLSKRSRQSSAQSANSNYDSFSAVFIGKHQTADGGVTYAPIDMSTNELAERLAHMGMSNTSEQVQRKVSIRSSRPLSESPVKSDDLPDDLPAGTPDMISIGEFVTTKRGGFADDSSFMHRPLSPSPTKADESGLRPEDIDEEDEDSYGDFSMAQQNPFLQSRETTNPSNATTTVRREASRGASRSASLTEKVRDTPYETSHRVVSTTSQFGQGELDDHEFPEDSFVEDGGLNDLPSRSPSPDVMPPGAQQQFKFREESYSNPNMETIDTFRGKRKLSKISARSTISVNKRGSVKRGLKRDTLAVPEPEVEQNFAEGKRPPPSPFKNPTPKRRRTLQQRELTPEPPRETSLALQQSHERMQSAIGKRKDARTGSFMLRAPPNILADRKILRPRNPTPSQRRDDLVEIEIEEATELSIHSSPKLQSIQKHLNQPLSPNASSDVIQTHLVASEVAAFSERIAHGMHDDSRKRSVTTQDFLDEALKIMSFIRNKGRPNSGLDNLAESHLENEEEVAQFQQQMEHSGFSDIPSGLSISRPPSREDGKGGWRTRQVQERRPSLIKHLQKFQESEDDSFMGNSVGSKFGQQVQRVASRIEAIESDPPGIEIIQAHTRTDSATTGEARGSSRSHDTAGSRHSSQTSVDSTLARTTGSRKSETVAQIAPEAVAHLIPEQVAGMSFDPEKGIWAKVKSPRKESHSTQPAEEEEEPVPEFSDIPTSEDDPFAEIDDLTYDEEEEQRRLSRPTDVDAIDHSTLNEQILHRHRERDAISLRSKLLRRSQTAPESVSQLDSTFNSPVQSPAPLKEFHPQKQNQGDGEVKKPGTSNSVESVEHEIKINEGRDHHEKVKKTRKITLSIPVSMASSTNINNAKVDMKDFADLPSTPDKSESQLDREYEQPSHSVPRMTVTAPSTSTFQSSPLPPLEEDHELSFLSTGPSRRHVNFSVSLSRVQPSKTNKAIIQSSPSHDVTFYMSELSDFTVHQTDERQVRTRPAPKHKVDHQLEDRFSWGNHLLVKALQDNEPEEPYWEDLRTVDLSGKELMSLHLLDELCDHLEKADLSNNRLEQLSGAPSSLRCLDVHQNLLSGLTWWGHLTNLQYLDVSNNNIDSLAGFNCLIHLRELKADNNKITSLDGLHSLDGLLKVSLRSNNICGTVDFDGSGLQRLECLDLGQNQISSMTNLHWLEALRELTLDANQMTTYSSTHTRQCNRLEYLDLSSNALISITAGSFLPALKSLNLDHNALSGTAIGLDQIHHLDLLSLRSQTLSKPLSLPLYMPDITSLNLSLNALDPELLTSSTIIHGLQTLELASCGLTSLPPTFGLSAPNLRAINLNFNALKDLRPLLNIKRLSILSLASNRLSRLRKTMAVLSKLSHLDAIDMRANPFTIGFHEPLESLLANTPLLPPASPQHTKEHSSVELIQPLAGAPLTLPWTAARGTERAWVAHLDADTRLRRRVYGILLARSCSKLRYLDGCVFERKEALVRDEVWERLVALGVLRRKE